MIFNIRTCFVWATTALLFASSLTFANVVEVTVAPNGNVRLIGDEFDNQVVVHVNPDGTYYIFGEYGTLISYKGNKYVSWENITLQGTSKKSNIKFDMRDGNDSLGIGSSGPNPIEINNIDGTLGKGDDFMAFVGALVHGNVNIDGGPSGAGTADGDGDLISSYLFFSVDGNVRIRLSEPPAGNWSDGAYFSGVALNDFYIKSNLNIACAKGRHELSLWTGQVDGRVDINFGPGVVGGAYGPERLDLYYMDIGKSLRVLQSSGESICWVDESNVEGSTYFSLGSGDDELTSWMSDFQAPVTINSGAGEDSVEFDFAEVFANMVINGGPDEDDLMIDESQILGNLTLNGNAGDDYFRLDETSFALDSVVRINGSIGYDHVEATSSANANMWMMVINMGANDDTVLFDWNLFSTTAGTRFYGGAGTDMLETGGTAFNPALFEVGFEN